MTLNIQDNFQKNISDKYLVAERFLSMCCVDASAVGNFTYF